VVLFPVSPMHSDFAMHSVMDVFWKSKLGVQQQLWGKSSQAGGQGWQPFPTQYHSTAPSQRSRGDGEVTRVSHSPGMARLSCSYVKFEVTPGRTRVGMEHVQAQAWLWQGAGRDSSWTPGYAAPCQSWPGAQPPTPGEWREVVAPVRALGNLRAASSHPTSEIW